LAGSQRSPAITYGCLRRRFGQQIKQQTASIRNGRE